MGKAILGQRLHKSRSIFQAFNRHLARSRKSQFSTSSERKAYSDTIQNLEIGAHTRVLYQGFTGMQATANAKESLEYGTKIVGGVKPGFEGEHLGLPVLPSVRVAAQKLKPDASAIYVPGDGTARAIEEAIEAEIPLVVAVAEHIPVHDMLRVFQILRTQSTTRLVGPNAPGIINTHGRCRLGFQPLPFFKEGQIGIVAKSGTLSYETVASVTRAGLGQSYAISVGGDILPGTTFVDAFKVFEDDEQTKAMIMVGEIGGRAEEDAAEWVTEYQKRTTNPKPVMGLIGGIQAPPDRVMGHDGAWAAPGEADATQKIKILERAGIVMVDHPEKFGPRMKQLLHLPSNEKPILRTTKSHNRGFHTMRRRRRSEQVRRTPTVYRRNLYIKHSEAMSMLTEAGLMMSETPRPSQEFLVAISIDRTERTPCIIASPSTNSKDMFNLSKKLPFAYGSDGATSDAMLETVSQHLAIRGTGKQALSNLISTLHHIFMTNEAFFLSTTFSITENSAHLHIHTTHFGFDDCAFKTSGRQTSLHAVHPKDATPFTPQELSASTYGMSYVALPGPGTLGTIVNGAGLAMNTIDSLVRLGGHPANFLDTGGKATAETIREAFAIVCSDPRVKTVFVNIFGGLTRCEMIAEGIMLALGNARDGGGNGKGLPAEKERVKVPVVVRLRGTNEELGQKMVSFFNYFPL